MTMAKKKAGKTQRGLVIGHLEPVPSNPSCQPAYLSGPGQRKNAVRVNEEQVSVLCFPLFSV